MKAWPSIVTGALALIALQVFVGSEQGPANAGGLLGEAAGFVQRLIDPTVPALGPTKATTAANQAVPTAAPATTTVQQNPNLNLPPSRKVA